MIVASGVFASLHIHLFVLEPFGFVGHNVTLALLRYATTNETAAGLKVVRHLFRRIGLVAVFEHRQTVLVAKAVDTAAGIHCAAVHVHTDKIGFEFDGARLLVAHIALTEQKTIAGTIKNDGVVAFVTNGSIDIALFLRTRSLDAQGGVARCSVARRRIDGIRKGVQRVARRAFLRACA